MKLRKTKTKGKFRSKLEAGVEETILKYTKDFQYEGEKIPYIVPAVVRRYIPDFIINKKDGSKLYIEVKGYLRPSDRVKLRLVKKSNPDLDLRLVFAQNNLVSGTKLRYSDWAHKNGFTYSIGELPAKWFKE